MKKDTICRIFFFIFSLFFTKFVIRIEYNDRVDSDEMKGGEFVYVIYIDILFIINWVMDTLIFYCVSLILNKRIKHRFMIMAGALAALIYCMLIILPVLQKIPYAIYALVIPIPSLLLLYKPIHYKTFFKEYLLSMFVAALFGGMVFNCWYLINGVQTNVSAISIFLLIGIGIGICGSFYGGFYWIRRQLIFPSFEYEVTIQCRDRSVVVKSLLDTGNLLYTPVKHEPVLVMEYEVMKSLLSPQQRDIYEEFSKATELEIEEGILSGAYKIDQLIPFHSVGCRNGFLWGIQVENVQIKKYSTQHIVTSCIIGLSNEKLFSDDQFQALLHPEFILEEVKVS